MEGAVQDCHEDGAGATAEAGMGRGVKVEIVRGWEWRRYETHPCPIFTS